MSITTRVEIAEELRIPFPEAIDLQGSIRVDAITRCESSWGIPTQGSYGILIREKTSPTPSSDLPSNLWNKRAASVQRFVVPSEDSKKDPSEDPSGTPEIPLRIPKGNGRVPRMDPYRDSKTETIALVHQ